MNSNYLLRVKRAEQLFLPFASIYLVVSRFLSRRRVVVLHVRAYLTQDLAAPAPTGDAIDPVDLSRRPYLTCVCASASRCCRIDRPAEAPTYSLIRSKRAGRPGAYLLVGAHSEPQWASFRRASQDAHRSGHPRPHAPATVVLPEIGWARGPRGLAHRGTSVRFVKEPGFLCGGRLCT